MGQVPMSFCKRSNCTVVLVQILKALVPSPSIRFSNVGGEGPSVPRHLL